MLISGCSLSNIYTILTDSLSLSLSHTHTHTHTQVVGCLSVRIQANETIDSKHISHAASVCQHILLLSKTYTYIYLFIYNYIILQRMWSLVIFQILFVVSSYNIHEQEIHAGPIIS